MSEIPDDLTKQILRLAGDNPRILVKSLIAGMQGTDLDSFMNIILKELPTANLKTAVVQGSAQLPEGVQAAAIRETAARLTQPQQAQILQELQIMVPPGDRTRDKLWLVVISAFVIVLVGSFVTIAVGTFKAPPTGAAAKPELVLSMFTSVVGLLAGLFVPSPASTNK